MSELKSAIQVGELVAVRRCSDLLSVSEFSQLAATDGDDDTRFENDFEVSAAHTKISAAVGSRPGSSLALRQFLCDLRCVRS